LPDLIASFMFSWMRAFNFMAEILFDIQRQYLI